MRSGVAEHSDDMAKRIATLTSCCCAPSWRSRSMRRRHSSDAVTILARDTVTSARHCAVAMAIAVNPVNVVSRFSVSGGKGSDEDPMATRPQRVPPTWMGTPTALSRPSDT